MNKDGLLCLAIWVKKLDVYYSEIELKDANVMGYKMLKSQNKTGKNMGFGLEDAAYLFL